MTFNALVKIYSTKYFCNTKVAGLGEIFVQQKFLVIQYIMVLDLMQVFPHCAGGTVLCLN